MPRATPRRRAKSRLPQHQLDRHHTHTTTKSVWIAALAAIPATILALATLVQALHVEQKLDGRLTQLLQATRDQAVAEQKHADALLEAARIKERQRLKDETPSTPTLTYDPPKQSGK